MIRLIFILQTPSDSWVHDDIMLISPDLAVRIGNRDHDGDCPLFDRVRSTDVWQHYGNG